MTRDELVQAAIEALADVNFWLDDAEGDAAVDRITSEVAEVVVDTVLAKLAGMAPLNISRADGRRVHLGPVVIEGVSLSIMVEE